MVVSSSGTLLSPRRSSTPESASQQLSAVERLRIAGRRIAFHPSQPRCGQEQLLGEPMLVGLRSEVFDQERGLLHTCGPRDRDEEIRHAEVPVVLRNLVLEDDVAAKRIPREIGQDAMILMAIIPLVRED